MGRRARTNQDEPTCVNLNVGPHLGRAGVSGNQLTVKCCPSVPTSNRVFHCQVTHAFKHPQAHCGSLAAAAAVSPWSESPPTHVAGIWALWPPARTPSFPTTHFLFFKAYPSTYRALLPGSLSDQSPELRPFILSLTLNLHHGASCSWRSRNFTDRKESGGSFCCGLVG